MPGLPSHIFVVRHGNRLDAADKKWHLTSPTPYDPPLTYGGFLQSRQVGNQIGRILESAKLEHEASSSSASPTRRRKRYKIVIHSSPFLRCVQTSVGISSGLAQTSSDSLHSSTDVIVPAVASYGEPKTTVLRLDSFLGEWLSPEYFEMITPPPGPALMLGGAKAELLRREDYSRYTDFAHQAVPTTKSSLWNHSPSEPSSDGEGNPNTSAMAAALSSRLETKKGYAAPRPTYAASTGDKIPEGFVAHARDACTAVDYQWDSMRGPLDFGDGGKLGEEWTAMHHRFRKGLKKLLNWYAATEDAAELVTTPVVGQSYSPVEEEEDVETVIVVVSHGAGCNALIGAITHQPVLMDVGIASLTMALRNPQLDYSKLFHESRGIDSSQPAVAVHNMYDIRLSASTEHLQSTTSTPVSARSASTPSAFIPTAPRGRTTTFGSSSGAPVMSPFSYMDNLASAGSRSTSASAAVEKTRRETAPTRPGSRTLGISTQNLGGGAGSPSSSSSSAIAPSLGLWAPVPSTLRLMDDGASDNGSDDFPNFDQSRFQGKLPDNPQPPSSVPLSAVLESNPGFEPMTDAPRARDLTDLSTSPKPGKGPILAAPIKLHTILGSPKPAQEVPASALNDGMWSLPQAPGEAERLRDLSQSKRRWTVNERA